MHAVDSPHTCSWRCRSIDDGGVEVGLGVGGGDTALEAQHLPEGVLIAMTNLEGLPLFPEAWVPPRVCHAAGMYIDCPSTVDFAQAPLQLGIPAGAKGQQHRVLA